MITQIQIRVSPQVASIQEELWAFVSKTTKIPLDEITHIEILNRSIDARQKNIFINLTVKVYQNETSQQEEITLPDYKNVTNAKEVIIVGSGPAGLFAALELLEKGYKPIILERGKDVKKRMEDIRSININHIVNEDSNYCFGEGGAGTYSDGKLYTRSKKKHIKKVLHVLVAFGATKDILIDAHPHIGTNKLPAIITKIRQLILSCGGEVHFNTRVTDLLIDSDVVQGVKTQGGDIFRCDKIILATGHSARDIFELLFNKNIKINLKPLAIGVRVEHPQSLIDSIQYHCKSRGPYLPPAPYSIVRQINNRGVYSFCMCPGGVIAACATSQEEIVTNGWSSSKRSGPFANSGIVVELRPFDFTDFKKFGPLAAMHFQKSIEHKAWLLGGKTQIAPAQRLNDFIENKISTDLPKTSYVPGVLSSDLSEVFPEVIYENLRRGFKEFGKSMKGFLTNEAVVHAPETRTSSPISIPRDPMSLQHTQIKGLYPCGEGAGYAGGIVSAAMDGIRCAKAIASEGK